MPETKVSAVERIRIAIQEAKDKGADPADAAKLEEDFKEFLASQVAEILAPLEGKMTGNMQAMIDGQIRPKEGETYIKGQTAARCLLAYVHGGKSLVGAKGLAAERWPDDTDVIKTLTESSSSGGGFLISGDPAGELIELLRPLSVLRSLGPAVMTMVSDTKRIPAIAGGATSSYIGENTSQTASDVTFRQLMLRIKKLRATVAISNELNDDSDDGADQIVINDIVASMATAEDVKFIRGDGTQNTPKGLRYWAATTTPSAGSNDGSDPTLAEVREDLSTAENALDAANSRMIRPAWIMSNASKNYMKWRLADGNNNLPFMEELSQGMLDGFPVGFTNNIPNNLAAGTAGESEIYLVDMADVVLGDRKQVEFAVSTEASFTNSAGSTTSAFDNDLFVIRAITRHDLIVRHTGSVHVTTGVTYGR